MSWTDLPTNYTDAVWTGRRKFNLISNADGTVSFEDVTAYSSRENSFFGAADANAMNTAINDLVPDVETIDAVLGSTKFVKQQVASGSSYTFTLSADTRCIVTTFGNNSNAIGHTFVNVNSSGNVTIKSGTSSSVAVSSSEDYKITVTNSAGVVTMCCFIVFQGTVTA